MSLQPLAGWWPEKANQTPRLHWRQVKRAFKRQRRSFINYLRSQYYLFNAISDAYRAFRLNEDIALGSLMIMGGLSFAAISIFANVMFNFVLAASVLAALSGANLAVAVILSVAVVSLLSLWLSAFLQNLWSYSLHEGATRKKIKSLRLTIHRSLHNASQTATAWVLLMSGTFIPAGVLNLCLVVAGKAHLIKLATALPYILTGEFLTLLWAAWLLTTYGLMPQVALFEKHATWKSVAKQARQLVSRKGRLFALTAYAFCLSGLGLAYLIGLGIQALTHTDSVLSFLILSIVPLSATNATLTMLYRKRRLARS